MLVSQGRLRSSIAACLIALPVLVAGAPARDIRITLDPYFRDLRTVDVTSGSQTLKLLVDTGGGATLISPQSARAMGCEPFGRDVGHRMTGDPVTFQRCEAATLSAGAWSHAFKPVGVFDVAALLPKELPHLDGVLALDAFAGRVVTLDWAAGAIVVVDPARERQAIAASGLSFRAATGETGRHLSAFVPIVGSRGPLWFLLDSGNLRGTLVAGSVLDERLLPMRSESTARLAIGGRREIDLPVTGEAQLVIDGALGTDFFRRGPITLDLRARTQFPEKK